MVVNGVWRREREEGKERKEKGAGKGHSSHSALPSPFHLLLPMRDLWFHGEVVSWSCVEIFQRKSNFRNLYLHCIAKRIPVSGKWHGNVKPDKKEMRIRTIYNCKRVYLDYWLIRLGRLCLDWAERQVDLSWRQNGSIHSFPLRLLRGRRIIPPEVNIFVDVSETEYFSQDSTWEWWELIQSNGRNFSIVEYRHDDRLGMSAMKNLEMYINRNILPVEQRDWRWKLRPFQDKKDREIRE